MLALGFSPRFLRFAAACAAGSAITTLGVHLLPRLWPEAQTFEQQLLYPTYPAYRVYLWVVLTHIVLVWISMVGLGAIRLKRSAGPVVIGMLGFLLFGLSELVRTSFVKFTVNAWRVQYAAESNEAVKVMFRNHLHAWPQINSFLFFLLCLGFLIGNLSYGIAFWNTIRLERVLSGALLAWAVLTVTVICREYLGLAWLDFIPEWTSWTYQPAVRFLAAVVIWRAAGESPSAG